MTSTSWQRQLIPHAEFNPFLRVFKTHHGTPFQQGDPFMLDLVVPETIRAARAVGADFHQSPIVAGTEHFFDFMP